MSIEGTRVLPPGRVKGLGLLGRPLPPRIGAWQRRRWEPCEAVQRGPGSDDGGEGRRAPFPPLPGAKRRRAGGRAGPRALRLPSGRGRGCPPGPGPGPGGGSGRLETVLGIFIIDHQLTPPGQKALTAPSGCWKSEITSLSLKSGALLASPWRRGG